MKIIAIAAIDSAGAIGNNGQLLFRDKDDLKHFSELTKTGTCLWGRKTFESVGELPGRTNIVLTSNKALQSTANTLYVQSISDAIGRAQNGGVERLFVCGGAEIYELTKTLWSELYLTIFDTVAPTSDSFFPQWFDHSYDSKPIFRKAGMTIFHYIKNKNNA